MTKALKRLTFILFMFNVILLLFFSFSNADNSTKKVKLMVTNVVYETEEGYIVTTRGNYALPNPSTEVFMENTAFVPLIDNLKRTIGKKSVLHIYNDTVVGISSESAGIYFFPDFKLRKKKIYPSSPLKISTILNRWDADSYRLSIKTIDGSFCIFNNFEVSDYYKKVFEKLKKNYATGINLDVKITILYHKIENTLECKGEIEDIEL